MTRLARPLAVLEAPTDTGACCAACATAPPAPTTASPRARPERDGDRRITAAGVIVAVAFVAAGLLAAIVTTVAGWTAWVPTHLVLAGAAGTAIAAVLPFFSSALAIAPPADARIRVGAIAFVAAGATIAIVAVAGRAPSLGHLGGSVYLAGIVLVGVAAFRPLRRALGPRRRRIERAYLAALVSVGVGVVLATALLAGWDPVVDRWAALKPAHAWLNLVGAVSLVIVATLGHLAPTVEGSRIRPRRSLLVALVALPAGSALVAIGYGLSADDLARSGACLALVGALAVPVHGLALRADAATWTTDPGWHRLTIWSLRLGAGWFALAVGVMAGRVIWLGAAPAAWSLALVGIPFVLGWVLQVLIGSWSHLLPAVGPGTPEVRAWRRYWLGRGATARLLALDGGLLVAGIGIVGGWPAITGAGLIGVAAAAGVAIALAAIAVVGPLGRPVVGRRLRPA